MVHLGVTGIHQEYVRLRKEDVGFIRPPEPEHWGGWIATSKGPDGNILQMLELP